MVSESRESRRKMSEYGPRLYFCQQFGQCFIYLLCWRSWPLLFVTKLRNFPISLLAAVFILFRIFWKLNKVRPKKFEADMKELILLEIKLLDKILHPFGIFSQF